MNRVAWVNSPRVALPQFCSLRRELTQGKFLMQVNRAFAVATGAAAAITIVAAGALVFSRPASATAAFAKETGKACGDCHTNPKGGGALTPLGTQFKANGNKMPASP
jgi:mono/diheme cytochrome c family protein